MEITSIQRTHNDIKGPNVYFPTLHCEPHSTNKNKMDGPNLSFVCIYIIVCYETTVRHSVIIVNIV